MGDKKTHYIHLRNPWITAWWSAAFPGFGHLLLGSYVKGFLLVIWEIIINLQTELNNAIICSFLGNFAMAKEVVDPRSLPLYGAIYIYAIWDSYRLSVDINKVSLLADRAGNSIFPFSLTAMGINFPDKRNPWLAAVWSMLGPGLGQLYTGRIATGFLLLAWWIVITFYSHVFQGIQFTVLGDFEGVQAVVDREWLLFIPSIYGFAVFDAYVNTVEQNKLFEKAQSVFLRENYQDPKFVMPL